MGAAMLRDVSATDFYELHEELGKGGFGTVHRAVARCGPKKGQAFALKTGQELKLIDEASMLEKLDHPNVIKLTEDFSPECLVLELAEGGSLWDRISHGDLGSNLTQNLSFQLLSALAHCHKMRIVHSDVKPGNLLLFPGDLLKLADFGESFSLGLAEGRMKDRGTPQYKAPELLLGRGKVRVGRSIDMWSAGCVIGEMAVRQPLFLGTAHDARLDDPKGDVGALRRMCATNAICDVLGTPTERSCPLLCTLPGPLPKLPVTEGLGLSRAFPQVPRLLGQPGLCLLQRLLIYDRGRRCSAREALDALYFSSPPPAAPPPSPELTYAESGASTTAEGTTSGGEHDVKAASKQQAMPHLQESTKSMLAPSAAVVDSALVARRRGITGCFPDVKSLLAGMG